MQATPPAQDFIDPPHMPPARPPRLIFLLNTAQRRLQQIINQQMTEEVLNELFKAEAEASLAFLREGVARVRRAAE